MNIVYLPPNRAKTTPGNVSSFKSHVALGEIISYTCCVAEGNAGQLERFSALLVEKSLVQIAFTHAGKHLMN